MLRSILELSMNRESHRADIRSPQAVSENSFLALMRVSPPPQTVTNTSATGRVTNTLRATTITAVLEEILTHTSHPHGGLNE